jgi:hypothetical protein
MATLEPRLNPSSGSEMTKQPSGDFVTLRIAQDDTIIPIWLDYRGVREFSDLMGEAEGDVLGVVIGSHSPSGTVVSRYEPLRALPGADPPDASRVRDSVLQLIEKCAGEATLETGQPVGLFRTQKGGAASVTDFDHKLIRRCFPFLASPGNYFLVIRNFPNRPRSCAVFPIEAMAPPPGTRPALDFPFDEYLLRKGYLTDASDASPMAPALPPPLQMQRAMQPIEPFPNQMPAPRGDSLVAGSRKNGLLVAGLLLLAFLVGGAAWKFLNKSPQQKTDEVLDGLASSRSLELKVARSGSDMEISWDRSSEIINLATGGTLTIRDGPIVRVVALSSDQLREGHIWFAPLPGSDLDLRLEVVRRDGKTQAESVQVLNWERTSPVTTDVKTPPPAERWRDRTPDPLRKQPPAPASQTPPSPKSEVQPPAQPPVQQSVNSPPAEPPAAVAAQTAPSPGPPQSASQAPPQPVQQTAAATPSPRTFSPIQSASTDPAKPAPQLPQAPAAGSLPPSGGSASGTPAPQSDRPAVSNPVEQVPAVRNVPATPTPPAVEAPKGALPAPAPKTSYSAPSVIRKVNPSLTQEARAELRRTNKKVTVSVRMDIDESGSVRNAEVTGITGDPANGGVYVKLVAMAAARQWKFKPASINGKNVPSQMTVAFEY